MKVIRCILKEGREKSVEARHPWIFSGSIDEIDDSFAAGDLVRVFSRQNKLLGTGYLNPRSQIAVRMLAFDERRIDAGFFEQKIRAAVSLREKFILQGRFSRGEPSLTNAYRLIHSEGDFLPGLVVDRYADYLVAQFLTAGIEQWKETIVKILRQLQIQRGSDPEIRGQTPFGFRGIFEKDDSEFREWEGLEKRVGRLDGEEPPDYVEIQENGLRFVVDIHRGQKTGFFLDQRDNRKLAGGLAKGKRVLNCFAYTGAFTVYAAAGGATETVSVESSEEALNTAKVNLEKNNFAPPAHQFVKEDVFEYLRAVRQEFDLIVLDPPAFCRNKNQILQASRGYKDINLYAMKRLAPGGLLFTASCSSYITPDLFQKIIFGAAKDARRDVRILAKTGHAVDHPINIYHPEGEYLKALLCQID